MVVNAMLVAMVSHANQPCDSIYHVGSSVGNPVRYSNLRDYNFRYFTAKPCLDKEGKAIKVGRVTVLENMNSFQRYMFIRYLLPLKVIHQFLILNYFSPSFFCQLAY
jgi:fatty acyl-CoA reductase